VSLTNQDLVICQKIFSSSIMSHNCQSLSRLIRRAIINSLSHNSYAADLPTPSLNCWQPRIFNKKTNYFQIRRFSILSALLSEISSKINCIFTKLCHLKLTVLVFMTIMY